MIIGNEAKKGEKMAVMLWSFAACKHIKIAPEIVFHQDGYSEWILKQYQNQNYIGLPLLQWMGMTYMEEETFNFPEMKKWLRD